MVKRHRNRRWLFATLLALLLWSGCSDHDQPTTNPVQPMDILQFRNIISDKAFSGLVVVFATWCQPCREELPMVAEVYRTHSSRGARIIAVSVDDGETGTVQRLVNRLQLPFPVYHVGTALIPEYRLVGVPTLLVVNKGMLVVNSPGQQSARSLTKTIERLIETASEKSTQPSGLGATD